MSKTINVEYTNPITGAESTIQVTIDIDRYRRDTEEGATENFFLKATASGAVAIMENIDDLISDLLDGKPSHPKKGVVQALIDTTFDSPWTSLSVTPHADDAGFVEGIPCVVLDKYGSVVGWFTAGAITSEIAISAREQPLGPVRRVGSSSRSRHFLLLKEKTVSLESSPSSNNPQLQQE